LPQDGKKRRDIRRYGIRVQSRKTGIGDLRSLVEYRLEMRRKKIPIVTYEVDNVRQKVFGLCLQTSAELHPQHDAIEKNTLSNLFVALPPLKWYLNRR
jgi:hypothetical protein